MKILLPTEDALNEAAALLRQGQLIAFPTETVYGLGADAANAEALKRLYEAKGRPTAHPVIVHLFSAEQLTDWAVEVPEAAYKLAAAMWPGPLTMILRRAPHVLDAVTGGQNSVGLRVPSHPAARRLLSRFKGGVAAPSANKFGRLSPTTAADVAHDFEQEVAMVLDGGPSEVGIESTIVDFTGEAPRILRPGMILPQQVETIAGKLQILHHPMGTPRAPGMLKSHYAPATPTQVVAADAINSKIASLTQTGAKVAALSFQEGMPGCLQLIVASKDPSRYAHELYRNLRKLDSLGADFIVVEAVPETDAWAGVADRLKRASAETSGQA
ncbi:MAG TPA: L-threonylcarbamoyladenylate synthase [Candidatus Obscuribacterales bacterium]